MNAKEEAFMKDFLALLKKHKIKFTFCDDCGEAEGVPPSNYSFEDTRDFRIVLDDAIAFLDEEGRRELKGEARKEVREKKRRERAFMDEFLVLLENYQ